MRSCVSALAAWLVLVAVATPGLARNPWEGRPAYGMHLMTPMERRAYRKSIQALPTADEQGAYWRAHIEKMQRRALARGVSIEDPPSMPVPEGEQGSPHPRPPYLKEVMTDEEVLFYYETLKASKDRAERRAIVAAHIEKMQALSIARGFSAPSTGAFANELAPPVKRTRKRPFGQLSKRRARKGKRGP